MGLFLPFLGILVPMNFRNSGKMLFILVREFWNLVREKSGNFTFYDLWEPCECMRPDSNSAYTGFCP